MSIARSEVIEDGDCPAVERLLAEAADYEPVRELGASVIMQALGRKRQSGRRWATLTVASSTAVVILVALVVRSQQSEIPDPAIRPVPPAPRVASADPPPTAPTMGQTSRGSATMHRPPAARPGAQAPAAKRAPVSGQHPREAKVGRRERVRRPVPQMRWERQTVKRYYAGVVEPAWLAEHDEETSAVRFTPVLVDIPTDHLERAPDAPASAVRLHPVRFVSDER